MKIPKEGISKKIQNLTADLKESETVNSILMKLISQLETN